MKLTTQQSVSYETGQCPKDYTDVTVIVLREEQGATKCSDHNMHNQPHPKNTKGSSDNILWWGGGENHTSKKITLDFEEGKGTTDADSSIRRKLGNR